VHTIMKLRGELGYGLQGESRFATTACAGQCKQARSAKQLTHVGELSRASNKTRWTDRQFVVRLGHVRIERTSSDECSGGTWGVLHLLRFYTRFVYWKTNTKFCHIVNLHCACGNEGCIQKKTRFLSARKARSGSPRCFPKHAHNLNLRSVSLKNLIPSWIDLLARDNQLSICARGNLNRARTITADTATAAGATPHRIFELLHPRGNILQARNRLPQLRT